MHWARWSNYLGFVRSWEKVGPYSGSNMNEPRAPMEKTVRETLGSFLFQSFEANSFMYLFAWWHREKTSWMVCFPAFWIPWCQDIHFRQLLSENIMHDENGKRVSSESGLHACDRLNWEEYRSSDLSPRIRNTPIWRIVYAKLWFSRIMCVLAVPMKAGSRQEEPEKSCAGRWSGFIKIRQKKCCRDYPAAED